MLTSIEFTSVTSGTFVGEAHPNSSILRVGTYENETGMMAILDAFCFNENNCITIKFYCLLLIHRMTHNKWIFHISYRNVIASMISFKFSGTVRIIFVFRIVFPLVAVQWIENFKSFNKITICSLDVDLCNEVRSEEIHRQVSELGISPRCSPVI